MSKSNNFIKNIIEQDISLNKYQQLITRFPPEPNGYLHIGHAKSIVINFSLAQHFANQIPSYCNLRFDDTNPEKETEEYINSIKEDVTWLGFKWNEQEKYASDYFDKLYEFAVWFIKQGLAYIDSLDPNQIREYRGSLTTKGINSPYRDRTIAENLQLFDDMKQGLCSEQLYTLRLKIDMSAPNLNMRDPVIYRVKNISHLKTGDKWCIYPLYDYTHCISDALEGITHSICTLEFEDHRPLYNWIINKLKTGGLIKCQPKQIEFSRLKLEYTVTSKRKLAQLVDKGIVSGWGDPRMPTIKGMRERGYPAAAIKLFIERCGVAKSPNTVEFELLENSIREILKQIAMPKLMAVLNPIKITFSNYDDHKIEGRMINLDPQHKEQRLGERKCQLSQNIFINKDDFMLNPNPEFHRLILGGEVRLRHSYIIKCNNIVQNSNGEITELICTIDYNTLGVKPKDRKVKGVIAWVNANHHKVLLMNNYDKLFTKPWLSSNDDILNFINPNSHTQVEVLLEPYITEIKIGATIQLERIGYFLTTANSVNRIISLKNFN